MPKSTSNLSEDGKSSDTLFIGGLVSKRISDEDIHTFVTVFEEPVNLDIDRKRGLLWARYSSISLAYETMKVLQYKLWGGRSISARYDLGTQGRGQALHHPTPIRTMRDHPDSNSSSSAYYTSKSIVGHGMEYPFPSGLYFKRLMQLQAKLLTASCNNPLLSLLTNPGLHNKYNKEVTEVMAMVDAVERAILMVFDKYAKDVANAVVYVVGDGKAPLCAACLCLHFPSTWVFHSIDPILVPIALDSVTAERFFQHSVMSEEFVISPPTPPDVVSTLSIVVACHSHAPLHEFWSRIEGKKICVAMPCCSDYSDLSEEPILRFEDYEVYSPMRTVLIYSSCL
ncbi:hypothetical protein EON65_31090 [archaeon]|nr:MAG: hypothetical protein EON65_31090 [archaeon]